MELRIVNENPKYPPFKLIEPTTLGYIHLAAAVQHAETADAIRELKEALDRFI